MSRFEQSRGRATIRICPNREIHACWVFRRHFLCDHLVDKRRQLPASSGWISLPGNLSRGIELRPVASGGRKPSRNSTPFSPVRRTTCDIHHLQRECQHFWPPPSSFCRLWSPRMLSGRSRPACLRREKCFCGRSYRSCAVLGENAFQSQVGCPGGEYLLVSFSIRATCSASITS